MRTFAILLGLMFAGAAARADETAAQFLERAIAAHGGRAKLTAARAERLKLKGTMHVGSAAAPFTSDQAVQLPARYRSAVRLTQGTTTHTIVHTIDGNTAAIHVDGRAMPVGANHRAQLRQTLQLHQAMKLVPLLSDPSFTVTLLGRFSLDGRRVVGLRVVGKLQRDLTMYFDESTALLVKTEQAIDGAAGTDVRQEAFYSDYRELGGHLRPCKVIVFRDNKKVMDADLVEARLVDRIDPAELSQP